VKNTIGPRLVSRSTTSTKRRVEAITSPGRIAHAEHEVDEVVAVDGALARHRPVAREHIALEVQTAELAAKLVDVAVAGQAVVHEVVQVGDAQVAHAEGVGHAALAASGSMWMSMNSSLTAA
jgi:hypothetical protein